MKKLFVAIVALFGMVNLYAQGKTAVVKSITLKGTVEFIDPKKDSNKVWLIKENFSGKPSIIDSCIVGKDKTFSFKIMQDHQSVYSIDAMHWDHATFWSDADIVLAMRGYDTARYKIKIPYYNYVAGSYDNNFINMMVLNNEMNYRRLVDESNMEYYAKKATDTAWYTYIKNTKKYNPMREDYNMREDVLIRSYQDRPVLVYALRGMAATSAGAKYDKAMAMLDNLIARYPWLSEAKQLKQTIITNKAQAMMLKTGEPMPFIKYPDPNGKLEGLEKYKGKYLLVDFWASWCGPCRQAIPKVKELYAENKAKGFAVVSISIDTDKDAWRKAMKDEAMPWEQLLSDDKDKTMTQFQFSGIPTLYLVDTEGRILDRFTGYGPEVEIKIREYITKDTKAPAVKKVSSVPITGF